MKALKKFGEHQPDLASTHSRIGSRSHRRRGRTRGETAGWIDEIRRRSHDRVRARGGSPVGEELDRLAGAKAVARLKPLSAHSIPVLSTPSFVRRRRPALSASCSAACTRDSLVFHRQPLSSSLSLSLFFHGRTILFR